MDPRLGVARTREGRGWRSPSYLLPAVALAAVLLGVVVIQPRGGGRAGDGVSVAAVAQSVSDEPAASPTAARTPPPEETPAAGSAEPAAVRASEDGPDGSPTSEVAGARATPTAGEGRVFRGGSSCGALREVSVAPAVEGSVAGVGLSVRAVSVYPLEYLVCMLQAAGGSTALALADALAERAAAGDTVAVTVELWVTNANRGLAQLNFATAELAANGSAGTVVAVVGGRSEVVLGSGEGRLVTLVATLRPLVEERPGPLTLIVDPPIVGGSPTAGRFQLFLPLP